MKRVAIYDVKYFIEIQTNRTITHARPRNLCGVGRVVGVKGGPVTSRPTNSDLPAPVSLIPPFRAKYSISTNLSPYAIDITATPTYAFHLRVAHSLENSPILFFLPQTWYKMLLVTKYSF